MLHFRKKNSLMFGDDQFDRLTYFIWDNRDAWVVTRPQNMYALFVVHVKRTPQIITANDVFNEALASN